MGGLALLSSIPPHPPACLSQLIKRSQGKQTHQNGLLHGAGGSKVSVHSGPATFLQRECLFFSVCPACFSSSCAMTAGGRLYFKATHEHCCLRMNQGPRGQACDLGICWRAVLPTPPTSQSPGPPPLLPPTHLPFCLVPRKGLGCLWSCPGLVLSCESRPVAEPTCVWCRLPPLVSGWGRIQAVLASGGPGAASSRPATCRGRAWRARSSWLLLGPQMALRDS